MGLNNYLCQFPLFTVIAINTEQDSHLEYLSPLHTCMLLASKRISKDYWGAEGTQKPLFLEKQFIVPALLIVNLF